MVLRGSQESCFYPIYLVSSTCQLLWAAKSFADATCSSDFISPSAMIPEHRLAELLTQVKEAQAQNCVYHVDPRGPSLYMNHNCERQDFPLDTICELDLHRDEVWFLQFSNDGTKLATASKDTTVVIYETATFRYLHRLAEHAGKVAYLAWSPDDTKLVTCSKDEIASVKLWDVEVG